jgi:hypothetical protein
MPDYNEYLYIDYENVQDVNVRFINKTTKVKIIVGQDQKNIPADLVIKTQPFGEAVEWIKVEGKGKNALDFFIAFYLGKDASLYKDKKFIIYSKDSGYDPLIEHQNSKKINAKRIVSFKELAPTPQIKADDPYFMKVIDDLRNIQSASRPKKRKTLMGFISAHMNGSTQTEKDRLLEDLFIKKIVFEENSNIKYNLPK